MSALRAGALVAAFVAGPPLWLLVQSGQLDSGAALERGAMIAAVCALGASGLGALVRHYETQARQRRREELLAQAAEALDSMAPTDRAA